MSNKQKNWDNIYTKENMTIWEPQQSVVQFTARFIKRRVSYDEYEVKRDSKKVLDLGCGNGAVPHFLSKQGFETYGIDISKDAIEMAKDYLEKEKLKANFAVCSANNLPYEDNSFDFITCFGVLDHVDSKIALGTIKEVKRVLKSKSLFFITLCSSTSSAFGKGKKTEGHTYVLEEGYEKGEIQHYFDVEEIRELLFGFKIIDLRHSIEHVYNEKRDVKATFARWFVTAELE